MRLIVVLIAVLMVPSGNAAADEAPDRFWLSASGGVGAGTKQSGSMNLVAKFDGYVWLRDGVGVVATSMMSPTADGRVLAAGVAYRIDLERADARSGVPNHLHVAGLVGRDRERGLAWMARIAMHRRYGAMLLSIDLVGYGSAGASASWITTVGVGIAL